MPYKTEIIFRLYRIRIEFSIVGSEMTGNECAGLSEMLLLCDTCTNWHVLRNAVHKMRKYFSWDGCFDAFFEFRAVQVARERTDTKRNDLCISLHWKSSTQCNCDAYSAKRKIWVRKNDGAIENIFSKCHCQHLSRTQYVESQSIIAIELYTHSPIFISQSEVKMRIYFCSVE